MPKKRTTFSFAIKKNNKFKPIPRYTEKQKKDILLERGKFKKTPTLYAVKKRGKKVIKAVKV